MIQKVCLVGHGKGTVDVRRYKNVRLQVRGLLDGEVNFYTHNKTHNVTQDAEVHIEPSDFLTIDARTKSSVIVKLLAHNI